MLVVLSFQQPASCLFHEKQIGSGAAKLISSLHLNQLGIATLILIVIQAGIAGPPHQNSQGFELFSMIIPSADISCTIVVIS